MARRGPGCKRKWHDSLVLGSADGGDRGAIIGILIRGVRAEEISEVITSTYSALPSQC